MCSISALRIGRHSAHFDPFTENLLPTARAERREAAMAQGQMRGNREVKKPKKKKDEAAPVSSLSAKGAQVPFGGTKRPPKK
jgi:hypothetical protein